MLSNDDVIIIMLSSDGVILIILSSAGIIIVSSIPTCVLLCMSTGKISGEPVAAADGQPGGDHHQTGQAERREQCPR